jgi:putative oxidoreductase
MKKYLFNTPNDGVLTVLRLTLGSLFFAHGAQKMLGWFGGYGFDATMNAFTTQMGIPAVFAFLAIAAEFFGGLGLIFGALTRVAALGIASVMAVAATMVHAQFGLFMNWAGTQKGEGFEYHLLALAISMALMIRGAGAFSVDRWLATRTAVAGDLHSQDSAQAWPARS